MSDRHELLLLDTLTGKLASPSSSSRERHLRNLLLKVHSEMLPLERYAASPILLRSLLEWFNFDEVPCTREVLSLLGDCVEVGGDETCRVLVRLGAILFLQNLRVASPQWALPLIDRVLVDLISARERLCLPSRTLSRRSFLEAEPSSFSILDPILHPDELDEIDVESTPARQEESFPTLPLDPYFITLLAQLSHRNSNVASDSLTRLSRLLQLHSSVHSHVLLHGNGTLLRSLSSLLSEFPGRVLDCLSSIRFEDVLLRSTPTPTPAPAPPLGVFLRLMDDLWDGILDTMRLAWVRGGLRDRERERESVEDDVELMSKRRVFVLGVYVLRQIFGLVVQKVFEEGTRNRDREEEEEGEFMDRIWECFLSHFLKMSRTLLVPFFASSSSSSSVSSSSSSSSSTLTLNDRNDGDSISEEGEDDGRRGQYKHSTAMATTTTTAAASTVHSFQRFLDPAMMEFVSISLDFALFLINLNQRQKQELGATTTTTTKRKRKRRRQKNLIHHQNQRERELVGAMTSLVRLMVYLVKKRSIRNHRIDVLSRSLEVLDCWVRMRKNQGFDDLHDDTMTMASEVKAIEQMTKTLLETDKILSSMKEAQRMRFGEDGQLELDGKGRSMTTTNKRTILRGLGFNSDVEERLTTYSRSSLRLRYEKCRAVVMSLVYVRSDLLEPTVDALMSQLLYLCSVVGDSDSDSTNSEFDHVAAAKELVVEVLNHQSDSVRWGVRTLLLEDTDPSVFLSNFLTEESVFALSLDALSQPELRMSFRSTRELSERLLLHSFRNAFGLGLSDLAARSFLPSIPLLQCLVRDAVGSSELLALLDYFYQPSGELPLLTLPQRLVCQLRFLYHRDLEIRQRSSEAVMHLLHATHDDGWELVGGLVDPFGVFLDVDPRHLYSELVTSSGRDSALDYAASTSVKDCRALVSLILSPSEQDPELLATFALRLSRYAPLDKFRESIVENESLFHRLARLFSTEEARESAFPPLFLAACAEVLCVMFCLSPSIGDLLIDSQYLVGLARNAFSPDLVLRKSVYKVLSNLLFSSASFFSPSQLDRLVVRPLSPHDYRVTVPRFVEECFLVRDLCASSLHFEFVSYGYATDLLIPSPSLRGYFEKLFEDDSRSDSDSVHHRSPLDVLSRTMLAIQGLKRGSDIVRNLETIEESLLLFPDLFASTGSFPDLDTRLGSEEDIMLSEPQGRKVELAAVLRDVFLMSDRNLRLVPYLLRFLSRLVVTLEDDEEDLKRFLLESIMLRSVLPLMQVRGLKFFILNLFDRFLNRDLRFNELLIKRDQLLPYFQSIETNSAHKKILLHRILFHLTSDPRVFDEVCIRQLEFRRLENALLELGSDNDRSNNFVHRLYASSCLLLLSNVASVYHQHGLSLLQDLSTSLLRSLVLSKSKLKNAVGFQLVSKLLISEDDWTLLNEAMPKLFQIVVEVVFMKDEDHYVRQKCLTIVNSLLLLRKSRALVFQRVISRIHLLFDEEAYEMQNLSFFVVYNYVCVLQEENWLEMDSHSHWLRSPKMLHWLFGLLSRERVTDLNVQVLDLLSLLYQQELQHEEKALLLSEDQLNFALQNLFLDNNVTARFLTSMMGFVRLLSILYSTRKFSLSDLKSVKSILFFFHFLHTMEDPTSSSGDRDRTNLFRIVDVGKIVSRCFLDLSPSDRSQYGSFLTFICHRLSNTVSHMCLREERRDSSATENLHLYLVCLLRILRNVVLDCPGLKELCVINHGLLEHAIFPFWHYLSSSSRTEESSSYEYEVLAVLLNLLVGCKKAKSCFLRIDLARGFPFLKLIVRYTTNFASPSLSVFVLSSKVLGCLLVDPPEDERSIITRFSLVESFDQILSQLVRKVRRSILRKMKPLSSLRRLSCLLRLISLISMDTMGLQELFSSSSLFDTLCSVAFDSTILPLDAVGTSSSTQSLVLDCLTHCYLCLRNMAVVRPAKAVFAFTQRESTERMLRLFLSPASTVTYRLKAYIVSLIWNLLQNNRKMIVLFKEIGFGSSLEDVLRVMERDGSVILSLVEEGDEERNWFDVIVRYLQKIVNSMNG